MSLESLAFLLGLVAAIRFTKVGTFMREDASVCGKRGARVATWCEPRSDGDGKRSGR